MLALSIIPFKSLGSLNAGPTPRIVLHGPIASFSFSSLQPATPIRPRRPPTVFLIKFSTNSPGLPNELINCIILSRPPRAALNPSAA